MGKRVMIVDDAPFMRTMIRDILQPYGFEIVAEGANGEEAVALYAQHKPDVMTLDIVMPKVTGLEALKRIMQADPKAKVIMVTAIDQREALMEAIKVGAADFIVKPFDDERVLSAVKKAVNE